MSCFCSCIIFIFYPIDLLAENSYNNDNQSGPSSAEEAAFPPTYAALPTTKLEEELNPFEQSFENIEDKQKQPLQHNLPSLQMLETTYMNDENEWDSSSRSGILSPSMLSRATNTNTTGKLIFLLIVYCYTKCCYIRLSLQFDNINI